MDYSPISGHVIAALQAFSRTNDPARIGQFIGQSQRRARSGNDAKGAMGNSGQARAPKIGSFQSYQLAFRADSRVPGRGARVGLVPANESPHGADCATVPRSPGCLWEAAQQSASRSRTRWRDVPITFDQRGMTLPPAHIRSSLDKPPRTRGLEPRESPVRRCRHYQPPRLGAAAIARAATAPPSPRQH